MSDARLMNSEQGLSELLEDVSNDVVILALCLVKEIDELDALDQFHNEEGNISLGSIALDPDRIFLQLVSFWDAWNRKIPNEVGFISD